MRETVTGRLLPQEVLKLTSASRIPMALLGGRPGVVERAASVLRAAGANMVEAIGPSIPFTIGSAEDAAATAKLATSGARIIFVGLGAPRQEVWMATHQHELDSVLVGIGAGLDVIAGRVAEAPRWMTRIGLEWAFRLVHEPRRLGRRYLIDDPPFFWWMLRQRLGGSRDGAQEPPDGSMSNSA
jgi:N-acetylglucosaminyldiphosphoundecaprenol N-acetyl-beta-D-mannosaminyltransferase